MNVSLLFIQDLTEVTSIFIVWVLSKNLSKSVPICPWPFEMELSIKFVRFKGLGRAVFSVIKVEHISDFVRIIDSAESFFSTELVDAYLVVSPEEGWIDQVSIYKLC